MLIHARRYNVPGGFSGYLVCVQRSTVWVYSAHRSITFHWCRMYLVPIDPLPSIGVGCIGPIDPLPSIGVGCIGGVGHMSEMLAVLGTDLQFGGHYATAPSGR